MNDKERLEKFAGSFKNKNKVDTDEICRDIRGKGMSDDISDEEYLALMDEYYSTYEEEV